MTARWEDVLDLQLDLSRALGDPNSQQHFQTESFAANLRGELTTDNGGPGSLTRNLATRLGAMVFNADPVYVDPDMHTVWEAAIAGFRAEPLAPTDLITPAGFLVLPRPAISIDTHGKRISWRAVLWHPQDLIVHAPGLVTAEPGSDPRPGDVSIPMVNVTRGTDAEGVTFSSKGMLVSLWHDPRDVDDYEQPDFRIHGKPLRGLFLTHVMPWHFGEDWGEEPQVEMASVLRPLQSLWRLMLQTIADRSVRRAPRANARRLEKAHWPEKHVTVVRLRRPQTPDKPGEEPGTVNWTHRWIVGSHWRWQWYPTFQDPSRVCGHRYEDGRICDKAGGIHRQIWISPFIKGPEELPLVPNKMRVFEWVR